MLILIHHRINPSPSILKKLHPIRIRPSGIRNISPLLHSLPGPNLIRPLLQRREWTQINLQASRTAHPGVIRNIGNGILGPGEVGAFLQTSFENGVEALGFVEIPFDPVVGPRACEEPEVVCLA